MVYTPEKSVTVTYFAVVICCAFKEKENADYDEAKQNCLQCPMLPLGVDLFEMQCIPLVSVIQFFIATPRNCDAPVFCPSSPISIAVSDVSVTATEPLQFMGKLCRSLIF